jgi:ppGpp synthetase/RelA/SpoT-type nucleotidyltranferase
VGVSRPIFTKWEHIRMHKMMDKKEAFNLTFADERLVEVLLSLKNNKPLPYPAEVIADAYKREMAIGEKATHELTGLLCSHFWDSQVRITFHAEGFCEALHHPKTVDMPLDDRLLGKIEDPDEVMGWQALGECDNETCHSEVYPDKSYLIYRPREKAYDILNGLAQQVNIITTRIKGGRSQIRKLAKLVLGEKDYVLDLRGIRFICPDIPSCYYVGGFLDGRIEQHESLSLAPIGAEAKEDYIKSPILRQNGGRYQAIHANPVYTILFEGSPKRIPIEIQIRDMEMHQNAESGEVSHAEYTRRKDEEMFRKYSEEWPQLCKKVAQAFSIDLP